MPRVVRKHHSSEGHVGCCSGGVKGRVGRSRTEEVDVRSAAVEQEEWRRGEQYSSHPQHLGKFSTVCVREGYNMSASHSSKGHYTQPCPHAQQAVTH